MKKIIILLILFSVFFGCIDGRKNSKAKDFEGNDEILLLASFNILRLGEKEKNYEVLAEIISNFDVIALQEVMNEKGVKRLKGHLEKHTGEKWKYVMSETSVGSEGYREHYAFIYRIRKIQDTKVIGFYEEENENDFMREPYGIYFKSRNFDFVYVTAHSIFGDTEKQRLIEATNYLKVYRYFSIKTGENDIIMAGDFNVPADNTAFENLKEENVSYLLEPKENPTTISSKGTVSSYDNFFINKERTAEYSGRAGVFNFAKDNNYDIIKKYISDHLIIFSEYYINEDLD